MFVYSALKVNYYLLGVIKVFTDSKSNCYEVLFIMISNETSNDKHILYILIFELADSVSALCVEVKWRPCQFGV